MKLPEGFVLDQPSDMNLPKGFVLDKASEKFNLDENQQLDLINLLEGSLPLDPNKLPGGIMSPMLRSPKNIQRQKAYDTLIQSGITKEQIQTVQDIQRRVSPGILGQMKQTMGEDIGGIIGGIGGGALALGLGQVPPFTALPEEAVLVPALAGAGAALLGGAGKTIQQAIDPYESPTARDFLRSATRQGLYEIGGRYASAALRATPFFKKPAKELMELEMSPTQVREIFKSKGGFFTPKQRDRRILVRAGEELSRGSFGGGAIFEGFEKAQQLQAVETATAIANSIADDSLKTTTKLGDELFDIFVRRGEKGVKFRGRRQALLDEFFEPLYRHVGDLSPNTVISTEPIKKFMEKKLAEDLASGGALLTTEGRSKFRYALKNLEPNRTLQQFIDLRSSYLKDARKFAVGADKSEAVFIQLADIADDALFSPTTSIGMTPEANKLLRNVNAVYGSGKELFDEKFIKRTISKVGDSPTEVLNVIYSDYDPKRLKSIREILVNPVKKTTGVGTTQRNISNELRTLRKSLPEIKGGERAIELLSENAAEGRAMWKQLNAAWFREQVNNAFDPSTGILNVKRLDKSFKEIPPETFKLMFPGTKGQAVKDTMKLFNILAPGKRGFTSMFGKTFELGIVSGTATALAGGSGISVMSQYALAMSPTTFAALATNPEATKLLTLGFTAKRGSIKVAPIAARLINILNKDMLNDQKEILKERRKKQSRYIEDKAIIRGYGARGF